MWGCFNNKILHPKHAIFDMEIHVQLKPSYHYTKMNKKQCFISLILITIKRLSCDILKLASKQNNLSLGLVTNKCAVQPAHSRSLISAFVIHLFKNITSELAASEL